ncbi:unnamed protein product, partial [Hydatigera taeniaeformis]|uniref:DRMBL domain-containing protein n=1 Tax=Hydatigena taeniaeformis TaxID=6205 RepID=A0A0R3XD28_HYDTA
SDAWHNLLEILIECDYDVRQFLLTPLQFGVPNGRLRYYLVARLRTRVEQPMFNFGHSVEHPLSRSTLITMPSHELPPIPNCECVVCTKKVSDIVSPENHFTEYIPLCSPISNYLLPDCDVPESLFLGRSELTKYHRILDIVTPNSKRSACFTKGYAHRFEGTGSFLQVPQPSNVLKSCPADTTCLPRIRAFHSKEIARLLCFPEYFGMSISLLSVLHWLPVMCEFDVTEFPESVNEKQRRRLLGNSINVLVVAHILYWAFSS